MNLICPWMKDGFGCRTGECALFDQENKVCALLSISMELKRIVEK